MTEIPKRLPPTRDTLRELYLKSGNRCAFPGCNKALFKENGVFSGQVCHIEAAEPKGERFNKNQTNEQRRQPFNLLIMCYDHHMETNDVPKFPVDRMRRIKEEHEKLFSDVVGSMLNTVTDHTTLTKPLLAENLRRINRVLSWNHSDNELSETLKEMPAIISALHKIPLPSRELFTILVDRAKKVGQFSEALEVSAVEVKQATNLESSEFFECLSILDRSGFTCERSQDEFGNQMIGIVSPPNWTLWVDLKKFCAKERISLSQFTIDLDFSILDD